MKNRIVSLFQLDDLLAPSTNGHGKATKRHGESKKRACAKSPSSPTAQLSPYNKRPRPRKKTAPKAFDNGAPIHCQHGVSYPPVQPVELPNVVATVSDAVARATGFDVVVEAFEDDDQGIDTPSVEISSDSDTSRYESEASSYDEEPPPEWTERQTSTVLEESLPESFAAQMEAVEADLAELAGRADHPAPNAPTPPGDQEAPAATRPVASSQGHAIFDTMAKGMNYATEFRLPSVQLSQVFSALDRELDADVSTPNAPTAVVGTPAPTMPTGDVLIKDLVNITVPPSPNDYADVKPTTAQALGAAIDVRHEVQLVPQQTGYSCWAAGAAMVVGWRDQMSIDPSEIAKATGYWAQYASGLDAEDTKMFSVWRLKPEAAQTYTVQGFADLLKQHGPLWVASAEPGPHIRVVTAIVGDGTPTGTLVYINDPWETGMQSFRQPNRGAQYTENYQRFVEKQETLGRQEIKKQGIYVAHA